MGCSDARKLGCAISLLQGDAYNWWMTITGGLDPNEMNWEFFWSTFKNKYLGVRYLDEKKREFMSLVQGNLFVAEYEVQFVRLSQYAPELMSSERHRCDRFRYGLVIASGMGLTSRGGGSSSIKRASDFSFGGGWNKRGRDRRY
ncbi:hypothetical protein HRI_003236500 [Hibiscus trionum]|uniref:Retrotransposon gag domain-containing protein n=1 Tax=Hibiscus trionum TaxID=183268 RepID=A0A9W7M9U1_HIBTR|nr:hypothetical protein HRI_003236500 [Hibiscus trionum]